MEYTTLVAAPAPAQRGCGGQLEDKVGTGELGLHQRRRHLHHQNWAFIISRHLHHHHQSPSSSPAAASPSSTLSSSPSSSSNGDEQHASSPSSSSSSSSS
ncbi:hypothetical protein Nmel_012080, partial [Mimus melanotis]